MEPKSTQRGIIISHVAAVKVQVKDLESLAKAAERCGLEFMEGQQTFKWFGTWVNDYSDDDAAYKSLGIDPKDYGKCLHALKVKGNDQAYEIGVVANPEGGYALLFDFYAGGYGLMSKVSAETDKQRKSLGKLQQMYALEVSKKAARKQGFAVKEKVGANGVIQVVCTR